MSGRERLAASARRASARRLSEGAARSGARAAHGSTWTADGRMPARQCGGLAPAPRRGGSARPRQGPGSVAVASPGRRGRARGVRQDALRGQRRSARDAALRRGEQPRRGSRLSRRGIRKIVDGYLKACGLKRPGVSGHALRHTAATLAYKHTRDLRAVQAMLGHASPQTTSRYARLVDGAQLNPAAAVPIVI